MAARKSISKKVRFEVFKRDGFMCQYCGSTPPAAVLEVDHIKPVSSGGKNTDENLLTSCFDCNRGKGAVGLHIAPDTLATKAEILAEKQEQLKAYERLVRAKRRREEVAINAVESAFRVHFDGFSFSPKFRQSVRVFLQRMTSDEVVDAMHLACSRIGRRDDSIKYFCGICWKTIRGAGNENG